jgi:polysaccharide pyruvyl transferase WcaK-like protein
MENQKQWQFPNSIYSFNNITLLGVGLNDIGIENEVSDYSAELLKAILTPNAIHSVRDSLTEKTLKDLGIKNVVNTACPTMWNLTTETLSKIPHKRGTSVITSVTDYNVDLEADRYMLELLKEEYENVYIWVQGSQDLNLCLEKIINLNDYKIINPSIESLNETLQMKDIDYIGTRLHAGIRALNYGKRTLIISVDNRARQIVKDTGLPVMERKDIFTKLRNYINSEYVTDIHLPWQNIELWKNQWK